MKSPMKYIIPVIVALMFVNLGNTQSVRFQSDYKKALKYAEKKNALVLFFFTNGEDSYTEENVEDNILKSSNFANAIKAPLVIVKVNGNESDDIYNKRMTMAYNKAKEYPSIRVIKPNSGTKTPLLVSFNDKDIFAFIDEVNSLID